MVVHLASKKYYYLLISALILTIPMWGQQTVTKQFTVVINPAPTAVDGPAALPVQTIDPAWPNTTGYTITAVAGGSNLQTALNNATCGTVLKLAHAATFTGDFVLPYKLCDDQHWVIVMSDDINETTGIGANLGAPGTRVTPSLDGFMPTLISPDDAAIIEATPNGTCPENPVNHYRLAGLHLTHTSVNAQAVMVHLGNACNSLSTQPHHIYFDRVHMGGQTTNMTNNAFIFDMSWLAVFDSWIENIQNNASVENHGFATKQSGGPILLSHNYISTAGQGWISGGGDGNITNNITSDVTINRNYFNKPVSFPSCADVFATANFCGYTQKSPIELKEAQRFLIEGNIFNYCYGVGPFACLAFNPRNQLGGNPWNADQDITVRYNIFQHGSTWYNPLGVNLNTNQILGGGTSQRHSIHDNLFIDEDLSHWTISGQSPPIIQTLSSCGTVPCNPNQTTLNNLSIRHNTVVSPATPGGSNGTFVAYKVFDFENDPNNGVLKNDAFILQDNIFPTSKYCMTGWGGGSTGLQQATSSNNTFTIDHNVFVNWENATCGISGWPGNFTTDPANYSTILFVNYNNGQVGGNFSLQAASPYHNAASDGTDIGANITQVNAHTVGVAP